MNLSWLALVVSMLLCFNLSLFQFFFLTGDSLVASHTTSLDIGIVNEGVRPAG